MDRSIGAFRIFAETVAGAMMAAMFATFIVQVAIRYTARVEWLADAVPFLQPSNFGWTLEFCLALWVWLVFWGNAFIVRNQDHVSFDILFYAVSPALRRTFFIVSAAIIAGGLLLSIQPTWDRLAVLRLKKTATLSVLFGDWIRMRDIYAIYLLFLVVVAGRYAVGVWHAVRHPIDEPLQPEVERIDA
ncbi:TRAP transporter small permease [Sinorhizobium alkalisoli]|uniref:TRAP transporter small permease n=1 Tax=Sinorhizobium alkalisoli TaxID=1752398 RepID=UPI0012A85E00|nr:TRAP transporter small permease subunit [Sinorhizobium alkalisoli]QFI66933.1 TRAP-type C4-dicarboxylate transport system, small permease component [Sinorhizobium alkalisoli]